MEFYEHFMTVTKPLTEEVKSMFIAENSHPIRKCNFIVDSLFQMIEVATAMKEVNQVSLGLELVADISAGIKEMTRFDNPTQLT